MLVCGSARMRRHHRFGVLLLTTSAAAADDECVLLLLLLLHCCMSHTLGNPHQLTQMSQKPKEYRIPVVKKEPNDQHRAHAAHHWQSAR